MHLDDVIAGIITSFLDGIPLFLLSITMRAESQS